MAKSALKQVLELIGNGFGFLPKEKAPVKKVDKNQWALNALIQNTLDQTAYTPAAQKYIKNKVPINYYATPQTFSDAYNPLGRAAGVATSNGKGTDIVIDSKVLKDPLAAINVLRHELVHSMDGNIYPNTTWTPNNGYSIANSRNMRPTIKTKGNPGQNKYLNSVLDWYKQDNKAASPKVQDVESLAYIGSKGPRVLLDKSKIADYYNRMYIPMSKKMNYSPVFNTNPSFNGNTKEAWEE